MSYSSVVGGVIVKVRGIKLKGLYEFDDLGVVGSGGGSGGLVGGSS